MKRSIMLLAAAALALASAQTAMAEAKKIAFFAASSQNGFNQAAYEGVEAKAMELGYETEIFDGKFDATHQYSQIEDVLASDRFAGMIVLPNDPVGVAGAIRAGDRGRRADRDHPLSDRTGASTASSHRCPASPPPSHRRRCPGPPTRPRRLPHSARTRTPATSSSSSASRPSPSTTSGSRPSRRFSPGTRTSRWWGSGEGWYSPDQSLKAMQDMLQAAKDVHAVLSNADQHLVGAEIALEAEGYDVADLYLVGGWRGHHLDRRDPRGAAGTSTLAYFPKTMGSLAMEQIANAIEGKPRHQRHQHGHRGTDPGDDRQGGPRREPPTSTASGSNSGRRPPGPARAPAAGPDRPVPSRLERHRGPGLGPGALRRDPANGPRACIEFHRHAMSVSSRSVPASKRKSSTLDDVRRRANPTWRRAGTVSGESEISVP